MASRKKTSDNKDEDKLTRIAIVSMDKCKPKRCRQECKKWCPVVRGGGLCIEADPTSKTASISEELCIGCGICVKKCPFDAIQIINLPRNLEKYTTHRYGPNSFKLHRLPMPRPGQCLGLVGSNGTGKSTALKILASKLKPNLGQYSNPPDWEEILKYFRGSELQGYFQRYPSALPHAPYPLLSSAIQEHCTPMADPETVRSCLAMCTQTQASRQVHSNKTAWPTTNAPRLQRVLGE